MTHRPNNGNLVVTKPLNTTRHSPQCNNDTTYTSVIAAFFLKEVKPQQTGNYIYTHLMSNSKISSSDNITLLRQRLTQVTSSWAIEDYRDYIVFYTKILPLLMRVERCTIYIMDISSNKICSVFGTGLSEMRIEPPMEGSIAGKVISSGNTVIENNMGKQEGFHLHVAEQTGFICHNMICSPIRGTSGNNVSGAVQLLNKNYGQSFTSEDKLLLEEAAHFLSISIETIVLNREIHRIANLLEQEADRLEQNSVRGTLFVAESPAMLEVLDLVSVVSKTPINVMLSGENGTGKELIARMIHDKGRRSNKPFVPVNCACIPDSLIESEFFGHDKGAFTGADSSRIGRFEESSGGTLFLDEIAEMPLSVQPKFLRAIQEQEGSRLGSNTTISYDLRLISATNKDLSAEIKEGNFREDLFFRLFSVEIIIPPLRTRREDILPLSLYFLEHTNKLFNKKVSGFVPEIITLFEQYSWPGNVRQLMKEVERLVALTPDHSIIQISQCSKELVAFYGKTSLPNESPDTLSIPDNVEAMERQLIKRAMKQVRGNKTKAAALLRLTRQGLAKKMKRYEL